MVPFINLALILTLVYGIVVYWPEFAEYMRK